MLRDGRPESVCLASSGEEVGLRVIGLGHVGSRTSIMNETLTQQTISSAQWGVGDQIGLRHLGKEAGCVTVPSLQTTGVPPA